MWKFLVLNTCLQVRSYNFLLKPQFSTQHLIFYPSECNEKKFSHLWKNLIWKCFFVNICGANQDQIHRPLSSMNSCDICHYHQYWDLNVEILCSWLVRREQVCLGKMYGSTYVLLCLILWLTCANRYVEMKQAMKQAKRDFYSKIVITWT